MMKKVISLLLFVPLTGLPQSKDIKKAERTEVVIFLGTECPISQKYVPTLSKIYSIYKDDSRFTWSFVIPENISKSQLKSFTSEFDVNFPLRVDKSQVLTKALKASATPEVVILRDSVLYRGAIDNWFYELGQYRQLITENYLADALESISKNQVPKVRHSKPVGCPIARYKPAKREQ